MFVGLAASLGIGPVRRLIAASQETALPQLTFTKVMPGSVPEYMAITVESDGTGSYEGRKLSDPPSSRRIKLSPATTERLFALADSLGDFKSIELASHRKVANLGLKTFAYERDGRRWSAQFNYTENQKAQELDDLFEGISNVEEHIRSLKYSERYDPLGLPRELTAITIDLENNNLTDPQLLTPLLKQISSDPRFLHIAQIRARNLLSKIATN